MYLLPGSLNHILWAVHFYNIFQTLFFKNPGNNSSQKKKDG